MKEFLKYTLATITGIILASILFFIILLGSLSAMMASGDKPVSIENNSILVLKAGVQIPDHGSNNPFATFDIVNMEATPTPGLNEILKNLEKAAKDDKIKGVLIENDLLNTGWATTEEIRNALSEFRTSGKFVISYSDYVLTQQCYYLGTVADKIFINPGVMLDFKGLSSEVMFFKDALEKLGIEVQVTRHGKFKGAVEPFILDKLSDENREQIMAYAGSIWNHVLNNISQARNIPVDQLNTIADNLDATISSRALEKGLVDGLIFRDVLIDTLKSLSGIDKDKELKLVSMTKYSKVPEKKSVYPKKKIAVIYAEGNIVMGNGNESNIGGNRYAEIIRKERKDSTVKAIVLRVNSPGGNAVASDIMWRELQLAAAVKPVVVSMGNYAASGGYYISAPATKIYANPTTISGSIGVFGLLPNADKLLEQKLGIKTEVVKTNRNADFPSFTRPMNDTEKEVMQLNIEQIYGDFVGKVASGREMEASAVDSIGQGRVWSGTSAIKIGLVDEIGGLNDAIKGAAELAGISEYSVKELPVAEDPYMKLLSQLGGEVKMRMLRKELGESVRYYNMIKEITQMSGVQARLPYMIELN
ncbi:MAG TPA: signal peptide peptidase SppA [Bacteroidales bacterium]|nr:signal peptide peptidase SppA [Bacteroidales bacterium]